MRERGLKQNKASNQVVGETVAPHAGAWIETYFLLVKKLVSVVAPHAGAWIETLKTYSKRRKNQSLPMRERGLKHQSANIQQDL